VGFPESFVDELRRSADIVRVISDHVSLKKMGLSWKGLCPFHKEKTPSFNVRSEPAVFHCFGCGEGGDVFKFVMLHERCSFPEAVETLAKRCGLRLPDNSSELGPELKQREELLQLLEAAAQHFTRVLWSAGGTSAREYLLGRGFKRETLEHIRAGAARDSWDDLLNGLGRSFSQELLLTAGLVVPGKDGKRPYDRFRARAVFPILNEAGKVVGFGARALDGGEPKYLNSPETPVYQKSRLLYGLSWAREAIRREGRIVLMEGYLDVARALEHGVGEIVATCGTALTSGHARALRRFAPRVVLNFDQDEAGQQAAQKSFDALAAEGLEVLVVELPQGHDPDTYLKEFGAEAYRERLAQAPQFVEWLIARAAVRHDTRTPTGKAAYLNAVLPALVRVENAVERAAWMGVVADKGGLDRAAAAQELKRALAARTNVPVEQPAPRQATAARLLTAEKMLVSLIASGAEGAPQALEELDAAEVEGLVSGPLLLRAKAIALLGRPLSAASLAEGLHEPELERLFSELSVRPEPTGDATPLTCVREIKLRCMERRTEQIQQQLDRAAGDESYARLSLEKLKLKQRIAELFRTVA